MELFQWFDKYEKKLKGNPLEITFVTEIFYPEFGTEGLEKLKPQFHLYNRDEGHDYYYDFIFSTENNDWIIETDGLYAHSETTTNKDYYHKLQVKQNWLQLDNSSLYKLIRFDSAYLRNPSMVWENRWYLRRELISDEEAFQHWYARREGYVPNEIQSETLTRLENFRDKQINKGVVIYPTGLGKTYLSAFDIKSVEPKRVLFILHVKELLKQTRAKYWDIFIDDKNPDAFYEESGFLFQGSKDIDRKYLFASIQTLSKDKTLEEFEPEHFDYIIIDETHHSAAKTYQKVINYFKPKFFLGLTATPERNDKKNILLSYNNTIFHEVDRDEAYKRGFLVGSRYLGFTDNVDYSNIKFNGFSYDVNDLNKALMVEKRDELIYEKFKKHTPTSKTIAFCVSILHAERMAKIFNDKGINSIAIHSKNQKTEQDEESLIERFKKDEYQVAFVVDMLNEGISINDVECLMFLRPTESKTIFEQQYGRGLRVANNKDKVTVLDFIGNHRTADFIKSYFKMGEVGEGHGEHDTSSIDEKMVLYYDNNGHEVHFEQDVIKHIQRLEISKKNKPDLANISSEWIDYGEYIREAALNTKNLYIKMGRQNRNIKDHRTALQIIFQNPHINDDTFKKLVKDAGIEMGAGFRSLILSKLLGFAPHSFAGEKKLPAMGLKIIEEDSLETISDIVNQQMEKLLYWNDISGSVNKYEPGETNFNVFSIYPYLFLELVIFELKEIDEDFTYVTEDEIEFFIKFSRNMSEYKKIAEMINKYRKENTTRDLELLLKEKNLQADSRFFKVISSMFPKYIQTIGNKIVFNDEFFEQKTSDIEYIKELIKNENLVLYENNQDLYKELLYSEYSIVDFHKQYLTSS